MGHNRPLAEEIEDLENEDRVEAELAEMKTKMDGSGPVESETEEDDTDENSEEKNQ